jgi:hypothetical protein
LCLSRTQRLRGTSGNLAASVKKPQMTQMGTDTDGVGGQGGLSGGGGKEFWLLEREAMSQGLVGDSRESSRVRWRRLSAKWWVVRRKREERERHGDAETGGHGEEEEQVKR